MKLAARLSLAFLALRELGPSQLGLYALYKIGLRSGYYRKLTAPSSALQPIAYQPFLHNPTTEDLRHVMGESGLQSLLGEADELVAGQVRLFGAERVPLNLAPDEPLMHWTYYETSHSRQQAADIKYTWEPARFDWAFVLGRAYRISGDERYPAAFWQLCETFLAKNPAYLGPNWVSAQEVALRLMAFVFALQVFANSEATTAQRSAHLVQAISEHAARIPATLMYARAQNNNHLLSEAAGLYTAGTFLPDHPQARKWRKLGWKWFNHAAQTQIDPDGAYCQHSSNYQRLMLQLSLWFAQLARHNGQDLPILTSQRLEQAAGWLLAMVDPKTGQAVNLGPNDGANIQPLAECPHSDYRPVLQAAVGALLGVRPFPPGPWDETGQWLTGKILSSQNPASTPPLRSATPQILRYPDQDSWAYLRVAKFNSRPGHADQLHLDLWRRGINLAGDPGTYRYQAPPPWDNALTHTAVHNTLTIDGAEQMRRVSRFLYLDWAQAEQVGGEQNPDGSWRCVIAEHDGYRRLGIRHQRAVRALETGDWLVEDRLAPLKPDPGVPGPQFAIRLHWLLPDWPWELDRATLHLFTPHGQAQISVQAVQDVSALSLEIGLARAGVSLANSTSVQPTWGWFSPTYGVKQPALSFFATSRGSIQTVFTSRWHFPVE